MRTPAAAAKLTVLTVRLPAEIAAKMRRLAKAHDRSLNGEIVRALRAYGDERDERDEREQPEQEPQP
jgi:predicted transcriptional regulator